MLIMIAYDDQSANRSSCIRAEHTARIGMRHSKWGLAATTVAISIAVVSSFQVILPSDSSLQRHYGGRRRLAPHQFVLTDSQVVVDDIIRRRAIEKDLERLFNKVEYYKNETDNVTLNDVEDCTVPNTQVRFKELSTSASRSRRNRTTLKNSRPKISRSSTMPGFGSDTERQKAYQAGTRLAEQNIGRHTVDTDEAKTKRRKANGEAMYKNSASVPESLVQFADEIHALDRISRADEIELGEKTQEAIRLQRLFDNLASRLGREPTDEEWCAAAGKINMEAISQAIEDGLAAKNKLVTSNLRMVQSVVNTYIRNGLTAQYNAGDMMQEGIIALIRASEKYNPDFGWKFSTYAMYWVRAAVKRSQLYQSRVVTVPQRIHENHKRLLKVGRELEQQLGRKPSAEELGAEVGMSKLQVDRCFSAMEQRCFSLDQQITNAKKPNSDNNKDTLIELIDNKSADQEHEKLKREFIREDLIETLNRHLEPLEVEVLLLRYGIKHVHTKKPGSEPTIAELSRLLELKPDRVRRTINRALRKLKAVESEEWLSFQRELHL